MTFIRLPLSPFSLQVEHVRALSNCEVASRSFPVHAVEHVGIELLFVDLLASCPSRDHLEDYLIHM